MIASRIRIATILALASLGALMAQAQSTSEVLDDSRSALSEWVEVKRLISKERNDWMEAKEILTDIISTLESEIEALDEQIANFEPQSQEEDSDRSSLQTEEAELREMPAELSSRLSQYEKEALALADYLPDPLADKGSVARMLELIKQGNPQITNRANFVISYLQEVDSFHNGVNIDRDLLELDGDGPREYSIIYLGLSKAFFVDDAEERAGFGLPGADGWEWTLEPRMAADVADAVAIREEEMLARFVYLPIEIKDIDIPEID